MKDKTNMEIVFFINKLLKDSAKSNEWMGFDYLMAVKRYIYEGVEVIPEKKYKKY